MGTDMIQKSTILLANIHVPVTLVCKLIGMEDVDYAAGGNAKIHCPFGFYHADGGQSKSFRIYETNNCYCFACDESFRPVTLYARAKDISLDDAAEIILEASGYIAPTPEARWADLVSETVQVNQDSLAEALKLYCQRVDPLWEVKQFDDKVAHKFRQCLELLPNVRTVEQIRQWRAAANQAMTKVLGESV